jgi:transposase InsO family protein
MKHTVHPMALFRLSILGNLIARHSLRHGELQQELRSLSERPYTQPDGKIVRFSAKTMEGWLYSYRKGGIEAIEPRQRSDRGRSKISPALQEVILAAKRENPTRSINELIRLLTQSHVVAKGELARASVHRLLKAHGLSRPVQSATLPIERRRFESLYAGDLLQGDVMHGPGIPVNGRMTKVYLVSLMDDASRLITHSAFCTNEGALAIEGVLKQSLLKRGIPSRLLVDNGSAYRSESLQGICARLGIHLIHSAPYEPQSKGKLERWHRTFRDQFMTELDLRCIHGLDDLNARLWAWLDQVYHRQVHSSLNGLTPLQRYQRDLPRIRPLGELAHQMDHLFLHRAVRTVRKDGTISLQGKWYEVPYELAGSRIVVVFDPHTLKIESIETEKGHALGKATPLDAHGNQNRGPAHLDRTAQPTSVSAHLDY